MPPPYPLPPPEIRAQLEAGPDGEAFRRLFAGLPPGGEERRRRALPCRHLGEPNGSRKLCPSCKGHVAIKLRACTPHGECSPEREVAGVACCLTCPDYETARRTLVVRVDSQGIGDSLMALTAVAGLRRDHPGDWLHLQLPGHAVPWANLFGDADAVDAAPPAHADRVFLPYKAAYEEEVRDGGATPRWERYAAKCGTTAARPAVRHKGRGHALAGHVVLVPFAAYAYREWPRRQWLLLEEALLSRGVAVAAIDGPGERLAGFQGPRLAGRPADEVADLMLSCPLVVGNDSGMSHLAGCLGRPGVAVCGPTRGEHVFGIYGGIEVVQAGPKGLANVELERVLGAVLRKLGGEG